MEELTAWERVKRARSSERPTSIDYISGIFDRFMELHGDRVCRDDGAIVGGIARIDGIMVTVIGEQKGRTLKQNQKRNFGMPYPDGYRKALRLMKQAEKFHRPVLSFINTSGAYYLFCRYARGFLRHRGGGARTGRGDRPQPL